MKYETINFRFVRVKYQKALDIFVTDYRFHFKKLYCPKKQYKQ